jgi:hypothetical protein
MFAFHDEVLRERDARPEHREREQQRTEEIKLMLVQHFRMMRCRSRTRVDIDRRGVSQTLPQIINAAHRREPLVLQPFIHMMAPS